MKLSQVASENDQKVGAKVAAQRAALRQQHEPIVLRRRDNSLVQEPATPPPSPAPQQ
jgi:hypothetical protein